MDITSLLIEYNVPFQTEGHKHCRPGWANMPCPFCTGNPGLHLGASLDGKRFYCWRCGWHPTYATLSKLLGCSGPEARKVALQYAGHYQPSKDAKVTIRRKAHRMPSGVISPLPPQHKRYLKGREFAPESLEKAFGLVGTGPIALLDKADYKHRIVAPVIWEGKQVSFQARDITGKSDLKYKACSKERELMHHKDVVYCHPEIAWERPVIIVEGITDVWRLGKQAAAVFGIEFKGSQIRAIARKKKAAGDSRVVVLFDDDPQAVIQANKLVAELCFRGMDCRREDVVGDPGGMAQNEANELLRRLGVI